MLGVGTHLADLNFQPRTPSLCPPLQMRAQQSPLPALKGMDLPSGKGAEPKFVGLSLDALPMPSCHVRPPSGFRLLRGRPLLEVCAWWKDVQWTVLCCEEKVPREGQDLAQSHTASQGFERKPPPSSLQARGPPCQVSCPRATVSLLSSLPRAGQGSTGGPEAVK